MVSCKPEVGEAVHLAREAIEEYVLVVGNLVVARLGGDEEERVEVVQLLDEHLDDALPCCKLPCSSNERVNCLSLSPPHMSENSEWLWMVWSSRM